MANANTRRLWIIPGIFFLAACAVNLYGCVTGNVTVERYVKGALMPLLAVTGLAWVATRDFDRRTVATLLLAQMLGWAGDSLLMGSGFAWFASGIGAFLAGHVCYICIFSRSLKGLGKGAWTVSVVAIAAVIAAIVLGIGIRGALLVPMMVYGAALLVITLCGICGLCRKTAPGRGVWLMVLFGGLLFLVSDGMIAMRTFDMGYFALRGFAIMSTYLVAQSLLCAAAVRIAAAPQARLT